MPQLQGPTPRCCAPEGWRWSSPAWGRSGHCGGRPVRGWTRYRRPASSSEAPGRAGAQPVRPRSRPASIPGQQQPAKPVTARRTPPNKAPCHAQTASPAPSARPVGHRSASTSASARQTAHCRDIGWCRIRTGRWTDRSLRPVAWHRRRWHQEVPRSWG